MPHGGKLGIGLGHEGLQLFFKQLICGLGSGGRRGCRPGRPGLGRCLTLGRCAAEIAPGRGRLSLGLGFQTLDGKIDLAVFRADDYDLHILAFGQEGTDIADVSVGHLRDMYQTGLILRQGNKSTKIGDGFDFAF